MEATRKHYLQHNVYTRAFGQTSAKHMEQLKAFVFASIRVQTFLLPFSFHNQTLFV